MKKRIKYWTLLVLGILSIPAVAMQYTDEVHWTLGDFVVGFVLLAGTISLIELTLHFLKGFRLKWLTVAAMVSMLVLTWAHLAVGIF